MNKKVLIRLEIEMPVEVPADWTVPEIEFWLNESSHCLGSEIRTLYKQELAGDCICRNAKATYVRPYLPPVKD